jgi:hypothetical protein
MELLAIKNVLIHPEVMLLVGFFSGLVITRMVLISRVNHYRKEIKDLSEELNAHSRKSLGIHRKNHIPVLRILDEGA